MNILVILITISRNKCVKENVYSRHLLARLLFEWTNVWPIAFIFAFFFYSVFKIYELFAKRFKARMNLIT